MVPSMAYQFLHNAQLAKVDLSSLFSVGSGGAHLPSELRTALEKKAKNALLIEGPNMSF